MRCSPALEGGALVCSILHWTAKSEWRPCDCEAVSKTRNIASTTIACISRRYEVYRHQHLFAGLVAMGKASAYPRACALVLWHPREDRVEGLYLFRCIHQRKPLLHHPFGIQFAIGCQSSSLHRWSSPSVARVVACTVMFAISGQNCSLHRTRAAVQTLASCRDTCSGHPAALRASSSS